MVRSAAFVLCIVFALPGMAQEAGDSRAVSLTLEGPAITGQIVPSFRERLIQGDGESGSGLTRPVMRNTDTLQMAPLVFRPAKDGGKIMPVQPISDEAGNRVITRIRPH